MTSESIRRVQYMTSYKSYRQISVETGIPVSTLSYVNRGLRQLPSQYVSTLRNTYQKTAYAQLKQTGMSATQANRYRWYTPEKVLEVQENMNILVLNLTLGAVASKLKGIKGTIMMDDVLGVWNDMESAVIKGLQKSPRTYEDWQDYPYH